MVDPEIIQWSGNYNVLDTKFSFIQWSSKLIPTNTEINRGFTSLSPQNPSLTKQKKNIIVKFASLSIYK